MVRSPSILRNNKSETAYAVRGPLIGRPAHGVPFTSIKFPLARRCSNHLALRRLSQSFTISNLSSQS